MSANIGRYYDRDYFKFNFDDSKKLLELISKKENLDYYSDKLKDRGNEELLNQNIDSFSNYLELFKSPLQNYLVKLKTTYPGLLIGAGNPHECGIKNEFKLSLSFDHTTGLPYIPASSVKGVLRSVFPQKKDKYKKEKRELLEAYLKENGFSESIDELEKKLFDSNGKNIFFDGYIKSGDNNGLFLDEDYITPHGDNPLKNPIPLRFLKIRPDVTICFQFKIEKDIKEKVGDLFKDILLEVGIGAKTNVGYGQFIE